jgi:hypothetical protein
MDNDAVSNLIGSKPGLSLVWEIFRFLELAKLLHLVDLSHKI